MVVKCFVCEQDLDTRVDKYVSRTEDNGAFINDELAPRAHYYCRYPNEQ